ncbi:DNA helicase RecQ [Alkalibacterium kapii]|uniref:DNA helicase RecQ n=1 Tax=Alkalibacterium kapii TaxID=426704 RepID=A0A511AWF5_9LACT|nr:DNA helicase RecQ [Alkalibacterium kapii]GEK91663.1 ATP-dependent DNA helicase RecQ [Alkalibacterium kapii]
MKDIFQTLKHHYGYDSFRPGQKELIEAILNGKDALGVMPTGGGKSVCYQIPAIIMDGLTLVVSPLISLMKDQVDALQTMGIKAAYLNSQLSYTDQRVIMEEAKRGELDLLYVSPERLGNHQFMSYASSWKLDLIAVDEAHCVSQWGHDFRPSYQRIPELMEVLPTRPVFAAFTATATKTVQNDMIDQLHMNNPFKHIASFDRPNLYFSVVKPKKKANHLLSTLDKKESSIIYCNTRKTVDKVYKLLIKKGYPATSYHAGISTEERSQNQEAFLYDKKPIMVATNAFGMGIDKSNVRKVIHYNMPLDMESYYQEAGRAGRDGAPSEAILFYSAQDIITNTMLIEQGNSPHARKNLNTMISYCKTGNCLRKTILKYFDQEVEWKKCEYCSNCDGETVVTDITVESQKILSCIYRMRQSYGAGLITDVLRGKDNKRIKQLGFDELSTYGLMSEYTDGDIKDMIAIMLSEGYLKLSGDSYPIIKFTPQTNDLLQAEATLSIRKKLKQEPVAKHKTIENIENIENYDEKLYEELRVLRKELAQEDGKPPFMVFTDRSLIDMAAKYPLTEEGFLDINGVGDVKLQAYGKDFLTLINEFVSHRALDVETLKKENITTEEVVKPVKKTKARNFNNTVEETVTYYKEGQTIDEIADLRSLSPVTIVNHLCKWIEQGEELDVSRLVTNEADQKIRKAIAKVGTDFLKPIKEVLDDSVTYDEIKIVIAKIKVEESERARL